MRKNQKRIKLPGKAWQLQTAKAKFSELFRLAHTEGPQLVTRQGTEAVVILPAEDFERLVNASQGQTLLEFFRSSPLVGSEIEFARDRDVPKDIQL